MITGFSVVEYCRIDRSDGTVLILACWRIRLAAWPVVSFCSPLRCCLARPGYVSDCDRRMAVAAWDPCSRLLSLRFGSDPKVTIGFRVGTSRSYAAGLPRRSRRPEVAGRRGSGRRPSGRAVDRRVRGEIVADGRCCHPDHVILDAGEAWSPLSLGRTFDPLRPLPQKHRADSLSARLVIVLGTFWEVRSSSIIARVCSAT